MDLFVNKHCVCDTKISFQAHIKQTFLLLVPGKYVIKKWNTIRDAWIRTLSEKKKLKKSGAAASISKPYKYHNQMLFLKKVVTPGETHENVPANANETNKSDNIMETVECNNDNEEQPDQIMEQSGNDRHKGRQNLSPSKRKSMNKNVNIDLKMIEYMNDQLKKKRLKIPIYHSLKAFCRK